MRRTSSETIYDTLKDEIIFLKRKPGEEIDQDEISRRFDVSRSPVRDALMRLRSDALVVMRPQRGCWVSRIDLGRVDDECFFRLALEKSVIERYKMFMKPSDITRLEYFIALQKEAMELTPEALRLMLRPRRQSRHSMREAVSRLTVVCMRV